MCVCQCGNTVSHNGVDLWHFCNMYTILRCAVWCRVGIVEQVIHYAVKRYG